MDDFKKLTGQLMKIYSNTESVNDSLFIRGSYVIYATDHWSPDIPLIYKKIAAKTLSWNHSENL